MYHALSVKDLQLLDGWDDSLLEATPESNKQLNEILWNNGMNVYKPYSVDVCLHRTLNNNVPWYGARINGMERTDKAWLRSGYASVEAYIASTKDLSLQKELMNMNRTSESFNEHTIIIEDKEKDGEE